MLKKLLTPVFSLIVVTILCHCQTMQIKNWTSDDLIIDDNASLEFPEVISSEQASEDINFLIYSLQNGYGGRKYVPHNSFATALASLKEISNVSNVKDFHDRIDEALYEIPDNHLVANYKGTVSKKRREQEKSGQVGSNNISDPTKIWETRIDKLGKKKVLYISITKFPDGDSEVWKNFIPSVSANLKSADFIVIDLRGNPGGDDAKGMDLAKVLFGHEIEHPIKRQYRSQTPATFAFNVNDFKVRIINMKKQGLTIPDSVINELSKAQEEYRQVVNGKFSPEYVRTDKGSGKRDTPITGFNRPIYILMDGACGSSCEFTIAAFEWHSSAKRVGENTNGTFHFSNAGLIVLPNSKIKVRIPTQYSEYFDRRFIERVGFSPDVKVMPGEDAYLAVKKLILPRQK
jgi:hypothetical protein